MPAGFLMAQQGSIFLFVGLVLSYAIMTGRLDRWVEFEEGQKSGFRPSVGRNESDDRIILIASVEGLVGVLCAETHEDGNL